MKSLCAMAMLGGLMLAYLGDVEDRGGALALKSPVTGGLRASDVLARGFGEELRVDGGSL